MTTKTALDLLSKAILAERDAAEQLKRCQDRGAEIFRYVRKDVLSGNGEPWDQPKLAKAMGIHPTYLSKIENGKTPPGLHLIGKLLEVAEKHGKYKA